MALSPAKAHFTRRLAAAQAQADVGAGLGDQYQFMKVALVEDKRRLHDLQSIERKIELKAKLLPQYRPYIDGVLDSQSGAPDDVFTLLMLWHIDIADMELALKMATYAIKHGLPAPDAHQRSTACLVTEEIAEYHLKQFAKGEAAPNARQQLDDLAELVKSADMPDPVRAKLYKALGLAQKDKYPRSALASLERALELDARAGVKKDIAALKKISEA